MVTTDPNSAFREIKLDEMVYDAELRIYFDTKVRNVKELRDLSKRRCPICLESSFDSNVVLMNHVKEMHGKVFWYVVQPLLPCDSLVCTHIHTRSITCLRERKVFPFEQRLYTETDLRRHIEEGDPPRGDDGAIKPHKKAKAARAILARTRSRENELPVPILRRVRTTSPSFQAPIIPLIRTHSYGRSASSGRSPPRNLPPFRRSPQSRRSPSQRKIILQKPRKLTRSISAPSRNPSQSLFKTSPQILRALTAARRTRRRDRNHLHHVSIREGEEGDSGTLRTTRGGIRQGALF